MTADAQALLELGDIPDGASPVASASLLLLT